MYNYQLQQLFNEYEDGYTADPFYPISFIKTNTSLLHKVKEFDNIADFKKYMAIMAAYVKALVDTGRYNNAIDEALLVLPVVEKNMIYLRLNPSEENWYLTLCFQKGYAHFQLKDYNIALRQFKLLQALNPDNDQVNKWVDYSWYGKYKPYTYAMAVLALQLILASMIFRNYLATWLRLVILASGVILTLLFFWINHRMDKNRRKK